MLERTGPTIAVSKPSRTHAMPNATAMRVCIGDHASASRRDSNVGFEGDDATDVEGTARTVVCARGNRLQAGAPTHSKRVAMRTPTILLTNDDGVASPGLHALACELAELARVVVVAPDGNRSGVSHAITTGDSVGVTPYEGIEGIRAYACTGTPADCAVIGIGELCETRPDIVISGINDGPNLADDVNYSGTVAGAVEAVLLGVRALAVSLASDPDDRSMARRWESAAAQARAILPHALAELPPERYWNVNVPNLPPERLLGHRFTALGRKRYGEAISRIDERRDARYYRVWNLPGRSDSDDPDSDIGAVMLGYVSITPIAIDRTDRDELNRLRLSSVLGA